MTQRFIEFVIMLQQQAALFLGLIPNPQTGKGEVNLEVARMFIDQLVMVRAKTRGNLNEDESKILNNAISNLQMAFVDATKAQGEYAGTPAAEESAPAAPAEPTPQPTPPAGEADSKKKFSKSYGA